MLKVMYMLISPDLMMIINRVYALQSITLYTKNMCNCCQLKIKKILDKKKITSLKALAETLLT